MEELTELIKAMGLWGWVAVIACTAIVTEGCIRLHRFMHPERVNSNCMAEKRRTNG